MSTNGSVLIESEILQKLHYDLCVLDVLVLALTSVFAVVTWSLIPKHRCFRNFVFLNLVLYFTLASVSPLINKFLAEYFRAGTDLTAWIFGLFSSYDLFILVAYEAWIFLTALVFYMDLVTIFEKKTEKKVLKSNLFSYGLSLANAVAFMILIYVLEGGESDNDRLFRNINSIINKHKMFVCVFFVAAHLFIYVQVLRSILRVSEERRLKVQVSLIVFFVSGIFIITCLLFCYVQDHGGTTLTVSQLYIKAFLTLQTIGFAFIFTFGMRSNRSAWKEYFRRRSDVNF